MPRSKSRGFKGLQLEVGGRRDPGLPVIVNLTSFMKGLNVIDTLSKYRYFLDDFSFLSGSEKVPLSIRFSFYFVCRLMKGCFEAQLHNALRFEICRWDDF